MHVCRFRYLACATFNELGSFEHIFGAFCRVNHVVLCQVFPHIPISVAPVLIINNGIIFSLAMTIWSFDSNLGKMQVFTSCMTKRREKAFPCLLEHRVDP